MVKVGPGGEAPDAIARIARPIHGEPDLDRLLEQIGAARIVLIGEPSHGMHELHDLRGTLTRKLIAERGFAAVAVAGGWPEALRIDRYVRGQSDDESAAAALSGFERFPTWMWRNADVAAFAEWLAAWNSKRPAEQRAGFYGLDLYSLHVAIRSLLSLLDDADPAAGRQAREQFASFEHVGDGLTAALAAAPLELAAGLGDEIVAELVEMQRRHVARSGRTPAGEGWFHAMQTSQVTRDAGAYYRALLGGRVVWTLRDGRMADTIDVLAEQLGTAGSPARLVVWAHNRHVGDARATAMGEAGEISLGQMMRQRHPGEVALIGMTTHAGTVVCARGWGEPAVVAPVPPSHNASWEQLLHDSGFPRFYVAHAPLRRAFGERAERLQRSIGVVYRPEAEGHQHYHRAHLADEFDVVVHIDACHAAAPLDGPAAAFDPSSTAGD
ncbi:MAG TPA: erythromycin esterase family protein [Kofleriaceae bacterium]